MARTSKRWWSLAPRSSRLSGWALLPLRAFLGVTFAFAGLQKLANPNFFEASSATSIQSQLIAANRLSPLHGLLGHLFRFATPIGVLIAIAELAVGTGVLLGLWTRVAALGGVCLSLMLFLTVSFHSSPYYTGSDIVFVFAWLPLVVAGAGGVWSCDASLERRARGRQGLGTATPVAVPFDLIQRLCGHFDGGRCGARGGAACDPGPCPVLGEARLDGEVSKPLDALQRRTLLSGGALVAAAGVTSLGIAGAAAGIGRALGHVHDSPNSTVTLTGPASTSTSQAATPGAPATSAPPAGTPVGAAVSVPVGGAARFSVPGGNDPGIVVQPAAGRFVAFNAVCPHAGCTVGYAPSADLFVCPCHGSEFNADNGHVVEGPATRGLRQLGVAEGSDGQLYVES
jgi:thiosulfate dehydrogenase (quinone) large subunit